MALELTSEQRAVVNHPLPAHGRVLAGPGTGKSTTAVALAERLLASDTPPRVKFLTFTRAAAAELVRKLSDSPALAAGAPSTIHSFSVSALLSNPGCAAFPEPLRIPDDYEYRMLVRPHLARRCGVKVRVLEELVAEMAAKWESLSEEIRPGIAPELRARYMGAFTEHRRVYGYTLLAELPDLFRQALRDHDDMEKVDYDLIVVDEYQDLNACDLEVLARLAGRGASILAIGDDDQSIYHFRKAHPDGIRRFLVDYATTLNYPLTICLRSPGPIVRWAQYVIQGDASRERRAPPTCDEQQPSAIALLGFRSERGEARGVGELVSRLLAQDGWKPSDILILTRTDYLGMFTKAIKEELKRRGIPISDPSVVERMLAEPANRELLALLRLAANSRDSLAWWTLLDLQRGVGEQFFGHAFGRAAGAGSSFGAVFAQDAEGGLGGYPPSGRNAAASVWRSTTELLGRVEMPSVECGWGAWIVAAGDAGQLPRGTEDFRKLLVEIDEEVEDGPLARYLSQIQPVGEDIQRIRQEGVRFMTMVGSKGLTVRVTIIVGVDNDLIPRPEQDVAEERRLLYVAMTRARECLFLTWSGRRQGPGARAGRANPGMRQPSEFLRGGPVESQDGEQFLAAFMVGTSG